MIGILSKRALENNFRCRKRLPRFLFSNVREQPPSRSGIFHNRAHQGQRHAFFERQHESFFRPYQTIYRGGPPAHHQPGFGLNWHRILLGEKRSWSSGLSIGLGQLNRTFLRTNDMQTAATEIRPSKGRRVSNSD